MGKKRMVTAIAAVMLLVFTLAACGQSGGSAQGNQDSGTARDSQSGERSVQLQYQLPPCFPYQAKGVDCFSVYTSGRRDTAAQQYNIGFSRSVCRLVGVPGKVDNGMCAFHHQLDCSEATDIPCRVTRGKGL